MKYRNSLSSVATGLIGLTVGWVAHSVAASGMPTVADSIAANWATLAVTLANESGQKSAENVRISAVAALIALTPTMGSNFPEILNEQLKPRIVPLAEMILANPEVIAGSDLSGDEGKARAVLKCIAQSGARNALDVRECSNRVISG